jgi:ubiquinone/menaquinone biosynthesis C-methylase UbiE
MSGTPAYDRTDPERRRLTLQATLLNPLTEAFLKRAGVTTGMRVLELGCGSGDVSLLLARLVGPEGELHSIDTDTAALRTARARLRAEGLDHSTFEPIDLHELKPEVRYDAVVGRHILLHVADAEYVIRRAIELARPGGIIAFQEYDFTTLPKGYPALPTAERVLEQIFALYRHTSPHPDIGARLYHLMHRAGLPAPEARLESILGGGAKSPIYDWLAETYRSIAPQAQQLGLITQAEAQRSAAALANALREEALAQEGVLVGPAMISVFARKQTSG